MAAKKKILVVDDEEDILHFLELVLREKGYDVITAQGGHDALTQAQLQRPDLVLLDIMMPPGVDGYDVCRQIRENPATADIPVMFLSSLEDVKDKARGFEAGGNDYVTKPFEMLEVRARVHSLLKAKAYADAIKEAMDRDLRIAREIQMGILPADLAAATRGTGLDVAAVIEPARQVGGDLYEVLRAGDQRVVVALGDVSGKGIPASLFMAVAVTVLRTLARTIAEPDEILRRLNDELAEQNPRGMFVTIQCLVFDLAKRQVTCAGAGHDRLLILSPGRPPRLAFPSSGRPAGLMPSNPVESASMALSPGDTFVLFSDGVSEAMNAQDEFFGEDRLMARAASVPEGAAPADIVGGILEAVRGFAAGAPQSDDITILAARYR